MRDRKESESESEESEESEEESEESESDGGIGKSEVGVFPIKTMLFCVLCCKLVDLFAERKFI